MCLYYPEVKGGGEATVIILCTSYNQDSTIAQGGEKGPRATRFQTYRKYIIGLGKDSINCENQVDFDSKAKLEIFQQGNCVRGGNANFGSTC